MGDAIKHFEDPEDRSKLKFKDVLGQTGKPILPESIQKQLIATINKKKLDNRRELNIYNSGTFENPSIGYEQDTACIAPRQAVGIAIRKVQVIVI